MDPTTHIIATIASPFVFLQDEAACSNGSVTSVPDHKIYFGQHIGAWCGYPPGTFPPPTRPAWASESERGGEGAAAGLRGTAVA